MSERTLGSRVRVIDALLHEDAPPPARAAHSTLDFDFDDGDAPSPARVTHKRGADHGDDEDDDDDDDDDDTGKVAGDIAGDNDSDDSDDDSDFELATSSDDDDFDSETDHDIDDDHDDDDDDDGGDDDDDDDVDDDVVDDAVGGDDDADAGDDHHHPVDHSQSGDGGGDCGDGDDDDGGDAPSDDNGAPLVAMHDPVIPFGSGFKLPNEKLRGEASTFVERVAEFIFARSFRFFNYLYVFVGMMFLKVFSDFSVSYACADAMFAVGQVRMRANLCSSHLVRSSRRSA